MVKTMTQLNGSSDHHQNILKGFEAFYRCFKMFLLFSTFEEVRFGTFWDTIFPPQRDLSHGHPWSSLMKFKSSTPVKSSLLLLVS